MFLFPVVISHVVAMAPPNLQQRKLVPHLRRKIVLWRGVLSFVYSPTKRFYFYVAAPQVRLSKAWLWTKHALKQRYRPSNHLHIVFMTLANGGIHQLNPYQKTKEDISMSWSFTPWGISGRNETKESSNKILVGSTSVALHTKENQDDYKKAFWVITWDSLPTR